MLSLTQHPIVTHLKMEKRTLRPWRISARDFCKILPNELKKLWSVKQIVLTGETAVKMAISYGVDRKSLVRWAAACKNRGFMRIKPPILTIAMRSNILSLMIVTVCEKTVTGTI